MNKTNTMILFDIDETIFFTGAKIFVRKNGEIIKELSNTEFNTYQLQEGEEFTYEQFKDAKYFAKTSKPNNTLIRLAQEYINSGYEVNFLTARADFDDKDIVLNFFRENGIKVGHYKNNEPHIIRSGNYTFIKDVSERKKYIIRKILNKRPEIKNVKLFDDSKNNLKKFLELKEEFPEITFEAYLVNKSHIKEFN